MSRKYTEGQEMALGTFLSKWDDSKSFEELMSNKDFVVTWAYTEDWDFETLSSSIKNLAKCFDDSLKVLRNETYIRRS